MQMDNQPYIPPIRPNMILPPSRDLCAEMGEENIRQLLRDFYNELGSSSIQDMFPANLEKASQKSADFFIGLLGGPPLYHQKHGSPMMRSRHMPFKIDLSARQVWLDCFFAVLSTPEKYSIPADLLPTLIQFLDHFSMWMVNTAPKDE